MGPRQLTRNQNSEDDYGLTDKEHRAIVSALKAKNLQRAEEVMRTHFARGATMIDES